MGSLGVPRGTHSASRGQLRGLSMSGSFPDWLAGRFLELLYESWTAASPKAEQNEAAFVKHEVTIECIEEQLEEARVQRAKLLQEKKSLRRSSSASRKRSTKSRAVTRHSMRWIGCGQHGEMCGRQIVAWVPSLGEAWLL